ncbi:hypothetical protein CKAH01_00582 [Colletotrichum kahawae]|uniref:Uncharacterized protein n=1 Tax=Colletotrichum kahawae TaxID=34407 RepID=A0AAD9YJW3_COLKA|nr:hypothetical protein CKAH01_00582 [Colletotrichum kahawae]
MIWVFAIQPTSRLASLACFFSVGAERVNDDDGTKTSYFLAPPDFSISHLPRPWSNNDISLSDYGLWYACKESRLVIGKHARRTYPLDPLYRYESIGTRFVRVNGRDAAIPFFRQRDLTCLQVPPSLKIHNVQQARRQLGCAPNIYGMWEPYAFEYDASWAFDPARDTISEMEKLPGPRGLFLNLLRLMPDENQQDYDRFWGNLYLIQYGATLKSDACVCRDRSPFNGNGYRFREARREDVEEYYNMEMNAWEFLDATISRMKPKRWIFRGGVGVLVCDASTITRCWGRSRVFLCDLSE